MDLSENRTSNPNLITQVSSDQCTIGQVLHKQSIIIPSNNKLISCSINSVDQLTEDLINQLCAYEPEVIILGTGKDIVFPKTEVLQPLVKQHIGLEVLNNQSAARTFNVLLSENRQVVCLMIIDDAKV